MNAKQVKEAKRGLAMVTFAEARAGDFTHQPPKPVDLKHATTITKAEEAIAGLGGRQAIQQAGEFGQKTEELRGDRGDAIAMLRRINGTVASIAEETKNPGLMDRFRMPHGSSDNELAGKLDSFADAIEQQGLSQGLLEHNLEVTPGDLREMAADLRESVGEQADARGKKTGATASIPGFLKTLRECKMTFDAIYQNTYAHDAELLANWRSVSHVPRHGGGEEKIKVPVSTPQA